ncbi:MAG: chromosome segregation protein SMC [Proteobacteria bacterium]|nr:chromosome segregation protein SMC [Pseudomonadota bacterium]
MPNTSVHPKSLRLKKLRMSGFKSFVDPTGVDFPSDLIGVVGPNGCGKSNIIDAVRWVMGESSAKQLRGDSIADVIFNGSSARKPVGQASVELLFDNPDGAIGGEYANYTEISIKRLVTRDGQSNYYLNGVRCRRKDITDIFLGTGLGPRSYAIIEQGMISRLIEAKPEDLRIYLEESAGISKYKERRRETENRIQHTRENLTRIQDIRDELQKQINRLEQQAKSAEKYQELKQQESVLKSQLLGLRWKVHQQKIQEQDQFIQQQEIQLEAFIAEQRHCEAELEKQRAAQETSHESYNLIQERFYQTTAEISRIEQAIQHHKDRQNQLSVDLASVETEITQMQEQQHQDSFELEDLQKELTSLDPEIEQVKTKEVEAKHALELAENDFRQWQHRWDEFNRDAAESSKQVQVEQTRLQHLQQTIQTLQERIARLKQEKEHINTSEVDVQIGILNEQKNQLTQNAENHQANLQAIYEKIRIRKNENAELATQLDTLKNELQTLTGQYSSLQVLQQAALGKKQTAISSWLEKNQLINNPRLAQIIEVENQWQLATETVLGQYLQAVCTEQFGTLVEQLEQIENSNLILMDKNTEYYPSSTQYPKLIDKVKTEWSSVKSILANVYIASNLTEALELSKKIASHESIVTPEGIHLGHGWLRVTREYDSKSGVLQREQELHQLEDNIQNQKTKITELSATVEQGNFELAELEKTREETQATITEIANQQAALNAEIQIKGNQLQQMQKRSLDIQNECHDIDTQLASAKQQHEQTELNFQQANQSMSKDVAVKEQLLSSREQIQLHLEITREQMRLANESQHEFELRYQSIKTQMSSSQLNIQRLTGQIEKLIERRSHLTATLEQTKTPETDLHAKLSEQLEQHKTIESELHHAREHLEQIESILREFESKRHEADKNARELQTQLEQLRMDAQSHRVRCDTILEQFAENGYEMETVLANLPEDLDDQACEQQLEKVTNRITRLGPINLAAIDEFRTESERKTYLDSQHQDLVDALTTLEEAIAKIDRETRARFKETYDQVNASFTQLFPRLFGGGNAYLELLGDDLLNTGIAVIARPPGKRNSSIHLLSGGEKALTAVALVFSIFQLNPSPFCMLDEVDAPLDDANVGRFCELVKEMSKTVQFIFITHNKVTMEMADHLIGVTMNEPGVSRLVSVDVEQAVSLAEA